MQLNDLSHLAGERQAAVPGQANVAKPPAKPNPSDAKTTAVKGGCGCGG